MYDKRETREILNEFNLGSFTNKFKRLDDEDKGAVLSKILNVNVDKMTTRMKRSSNKNIKEIMKTKGDVSRYSGYKDIENIVKFTNRQLSMKNDAPSDLLHAVSTITKTMNLLEKESRNFKKAFTSGDDVVQLIYITLVSMASMLSLQVFTKYFKLVENSYGAGFEIEKASQNLSASTECETLDNLLSQYTNGRLSKIISGKESLNESAVGDTVAKLLGSVAKTVMGTNDDGSLNFNPKNMPKATQIAGGFAGSVIGLIIATTVIKFGYIKFLEFRIYLSDGLREASRIIEDTVDNLSDAKVKEKQLKAAERYRNLADKVDLDSGVAETKANREVDRDNKDIEREIGGMEFDI